MLFSCQHIPAEAIAQLAALRCRRLQAHHMRQPLGTGSRQTLGHDSGLSRMLFAWGL
jgi:hypothetical protein